MAWREYAIIIADEGAIPVQRVLEALGKARLRFTARTVSSTQPWALLRTWHEGPPADAILVVEGPEPMNRVSGFVEVAFRFLSGVPVIVTGPAVGRRRTNYQALGVSACVGERELSKLAGAVRRAVQAAQRRMHAQQQADARSVAVLRSATDVKSAVYALSDRIWIKDTQLRFVYASEVRARDYGLTAQELVGKTDREIFGPARGTQFAEADRRVLEGGEPVVEERPTEGGVLQKMPILDRQGRSVALVLVDGRTAEERRRLEDMLCGVADLVAASDDAIIGLTPEGAVTSWNPGATEVYGYSADEAMRLRIGDLATGAEDEALRNSLGSALRDRATVRYETVHRRQDGSPVEVAVMVSPAIGPWGETTGVSLFARDIGARKRAERALRESEERFRLMAETAFEGMSITEQTPTRGHGRLVFCNERFVTMSGRTEKELWDAPSPERFRRRGTEAAPPEVLGMVRAEHADQAYWERSRARLDSGLPVLEIGSWERPDGAENYHERSCVVVEAGGRKLLFAVDRDVTEALRRERELRDVLGQLALSHAELDRFVPAAGGDEDRGPYQQDVQQIAGEVRQDPLRDHDFRAAAESLHMSYGYFRRLFRRYLGHAPHDYLLLWRMRRAARMLRNSDRSVKAVARELGYDDPAHFCKLFKSKMGMTPTAYCSAVSSSEPATPVSVPRASRSRPRRPQPLRPSGGRRPPDRRERPAPQAR